ncbi:MAG: biotin/lipoyl-containing protein, partial [Halohasta sp.]
MSHEFELPELGSDASEGTLVDCHIEPGETVEAGETVLEVETAKSVSEVSAPVDGQVTEIHAETGDTVAVGDLVVTFETDSVEIDETDDAAEEVDAAGEADDDGDDGPTPAVTRVDRDDDADASADATASDERAGGEDDGPTPAVTRISDNESAADLSTGELDGVPASTEVLVIGAGPGGYVAAIRAAQLGLDVTLVEKDAYGGTCLNTGCIPSKALIHGAEIAHEATHAEPLGITAEVDVDVGQLVDWKNGVVDQLTGGVEGLCKANGVALVDGEATFVDDHRAKVATD